MSDVLKVFLCHSSGDKSAVRNLYRALSSIDGIQPWLDEVALLPGQDWQREIIKAVRQSDIVIVCLSRSSINKRGFVQKEIKIALDAADEQPEGAIFIIPALLEPCDLPDRLSKFQYVKLFELGGMGRLTVALQHRSNELGYNIEVPATPSSDEILQALTQMLINRQWRDADQLTALLMIKVAQRDSEGYLSQVNFEEFPCSILQTIDRHWTEASDGRFGFSVQSEIWDSLGGNRNSDDSIFKQFGIRVGWENSEQRWLRWGELTFGLDAPVGHLPTPPRWWELWEGFRKGEDHLFYRTQECANS